MWITLGGRKRFSFEESDHEFGCDVVGSPRAVDSSSVGGERVVDGALAAVADGAFGRLRSWTCAVEGAFKGVHEVVDARLCD